MNHLVIIIKMQKNISVIAEIKITESQRKLNNNSETKPEILKYLKNFKNYLIKLKSKNFWRYKLDDFFWINNYSLVYF